MQSEYELTDEQVQDGLAFARMVADDKLWPALQRLTARLNADAIAKWEADTTDAFSKKWLRGYREAIGEFLPRVADQARDAQNHLAVAREVEKVLPVQEGLGAGDLAIA